MENGAVSNEETESKDARATAAARGDSTEQSACFQSCRTGCLHRCRRNAPDGRRNGQALTRWAALEAPIMRDEELAFWSIGQLGAAYRAGRLSPVEVTRLCLERIDGLDDKL